jgi:predicted metalloendopeptidase
MILAQRYALAGAALCILACAGAARAAAAGPPAEPFAGRDPAVAAGADFYAYANGAWLRQTEIPPDRSSYGAFAIMQERTDQRVVELLREAATGAAAPGSAARKVGDYFATIMDEEGIEARGLQALQPILQALDAIDGRASLARALGATVQADVDVLNATRIHTPNLLGLWVAQDLDAPTRYAPFLLQGGLGMPDRDDYLDDTPRMRELRASYRQHIATVLRLAGFAEAEARAARVFDLEMRMALVHASRTETVDVQLGNNHWKRADFADRAPGLDWKAFFDAAGLGSAPEFIVWHPRAVTGLAALASSEPIPTWQDYLRFHAIDALSAYLPRALAEERFHFYDGVLSGTPQMPERWKRAVRATGDALGAAVGQLYVQRYFPAQDKARIEQLVRNLIAAFDRRLDKLAWMDPRTQRQAKEKLAALKVGVGYPDRWIDYAGLDVVRGDAVGNALRAEQFETRRNLAKLGQPIDRGEWVMTPQLVNAVNLPVMNAIQFPAAILQPPFYDVRNPASANYGAIGAVIGHEISHSFDDQGALFDASGKLQNWWTADDFAHFAASGEALARQYDAYRPFPDVAVNGKLTLSENIADLAGINVAYDAYRISLQGAAAPLVAGLSGDQQFFLGFAQAWRSKIREPALRQALITDGHAPPQFRAATVRNLDPWYEAFGVAPGQALYLEPAQRVRVW